MVFLFKRSPSVQKSFTYVEEEKRRHGACPGSLETIKTGDGKSWSLLPNFYACHEVKRGDLVYYRFSDQFDPVVVRVYGIPGDSFEVLRDPGREAWNIKINRELILDSNKSRRFFGAKPSPVLKLYEKSSRGKLLSKNFIVFSDNPSLVHDSSNFGVVHVDDFLGKIEN